MIVKIYQCDTTTKLGEELLFLDYKKMKVNHLNPPKEAYHLVYEGKLPNILKTLDDVYAKFQTSKPDGYIGHTLSVSDIIEVTDSGCAQARVGLYFVDSIGFKKVSWEEETLDIKCRKEFSTVAELKELLQTVPDDTPVNVAGVAGFFHRCKAYIVLDDSDLEEEYEEAV